MAYTVAGVYILGIIAVELLAVVALLAFKTFKHK